MEPPNQNTLVSSPDSLEFTHLTRSSIVALDAEWKPIRGPQQRLTFPTVSILQVACQLAPRYGVDSDESNEPAVFLLDLQFISLSSIWALLKDVFCSPDILKLGFGFKQDLVYLSSTFSAQGGFDKVEPYLDIKSIYNHLQHKPPARKALKETKNLATICREVLGISLSKELQCSDCSCRPLTEDQKLYVARDAVCLLDIFSVFQTKVVKEIEDAAFEISNANSVQSLQTFVITILLYLKYAWGVMLHVLAFNGSWICTLEKRTEHTELHPSIVKHGLKGILKEPADLPIKNFRHRFTEASDIVRATTFSEYPQRQEMEKAASNILMIVRKYGEKFYLKECDKKHGLQWLVSADKSRLIILISGKVSHYGMCSWGKMDTQNFFVMLWLAFHFSCACRTLLDFLIQIL